MKNKDIIFSRADQAGTQTLTQYEPSKKNNANTAGSAVGTDIINLSNGSEKNLNQTSAGTDVTENSKSETSFSAGAEVKVLIFSGVPVPVSFKFSIDVKRTVVNNK